MISISAVLLVVVGVMQWIVAAAQAMSGDHSAMLRLVSDWNPKDLSWTAVNAVCNWAGVNCTVGRVVQFIWNQMACSGTVNLTGLPTGMTYLDLGENSFSGPVDLSSLPAGMTTLYLYNNDFCGSTGIDIPCDWVELDNNCTCAGAAVQCPAC